MKIALVSPYDFAYPGGVAYHASSLEHQFTRMGHEVKVIAPSSETVTSLGNRFIRIGKPWPIPTSGSISRIALSQTLFRTIKDVLEREKFDIIHLHEPLMPMLCLHVLRLSQTANVGTFHAYDGKPGYNFGKPVTTMMLRRWFQKLDGKIAVSRPARDFVSEYFPGQYKIIPNGVDLERFSPDVPPVDEFCDGKANILFVGRLEKRKGLKYLLEAYKLVKEEIPNSRLIVVGPGGKSLHKYEEQVSENNLKDVVFVGHVSYGDLPRYYKTGDVFCAPATGWESFGFVLLEAMAVGKPIVASNIEGYASVVTDGVEGLLVPPRDKERLARSLISLLTDASLRQQLGARGRLKSRDYSWEIVAQRVLDYYFKVLSEFPGREKVSFKEKIWSRLDSALQRNNYR